MLSQGPEIPIPRGRRPPLPPPPSRICQQARASAHARPVAQAPQHARPRGASLTRHCCGAPAGEGRAVVGWLVSSFLPQIVAGRGLAGREVVKAAAVRSLCL